MVNRKDLILVVDDDESVLSTLNKVIQASGLEARTVKSAEEALTLLSQTDFDLILMDVNMPGMDGFEAVAEIRRRKIQTPIIILSGRKEDFDTLYGLDIGADDYITKPFNPVTLGAKIKALIRCSRNGQADTNPVLSAGPFTYDTGTLRFYKNGVEIPLTAKENVMMKLFLDNVNRIFTKDLMYDMVWNNSVIDENSIMVYINRLRQKIEDNPSEPKYIQTVRGIGYRFVV